MRRPIIASLGLILVVVGGCNQILGLDGFYNECGGPLDAPLECNLGGAGSTPSSSSTAEGGATASTSSHAGAGGATSSSGGGGTGGVGQGGGAGAGGSSSSSTMVNCDPTTGPVDGTCGVFVSSSIGDDGNPATKILPVKTLAHAIELATTKGSPIYACGEEFDEAITVRAGTTLYGAFDCASSWRYTPATPTHLVGAADQIPLTLAPGTSSSAVSDFTITAADSLLDSGSSIGVLASSDATLTRLTITTGRAHDGSAGPSQTPVAPGPNGTHGGDTICAQININGGAGGVQMCSGMDQSGGRGGNANGSAGGPGADGLPLGLGTFPTDGIGGSGQTSGPCSAGHAGASGPVGNPGAGAHGFGQLTATGYVSPSAVAGASPGTPGQGGGGGGAAKPCQAGLAGSSGGGGGGGGCGGAVGNAGHSGGSSIGIAASGAVLTLTNVTITTSQGGNGGLGGDGQPGGNGGPGGAGGACGGGNGGQGGRGGSGGGGAGGHSVGIALQSSGIASMTGVNIVPNNKGAGAIGGDGDITAGAKGDDGMSCKTLDMGTGLCGM